MFYLVNIYSPFIQTRQLIQTAEWLDKRIQCQRLTWQSEGNPHTHLGDSRHQPHGLLGVRQEDFSHDGHEDVEDLVAGVTHPGDELREGREELVGRQVVAVLHHHSVYLPQHLPHLSVRAASCLLPVTQSLRLHTFLSLQQLLKKKKKSMLARTLEISFCPLSLTFLILTHSGSKIQPEWQHARHGLVYVLVSKLQGSGREKNPKLNSQYKNQ